MTVAARCEPEPRSGGEQRRELEEGSLPLEHEEAQRRALLDA